jgi:hypothetical protein
MEEGEQYQEQGRPSPNPRPAFRVFSHRHGSDSMRIRLKTSEMLAEATLFPIVDKEG